MLRPILPLLALIFTLPLLAQNLVPNPSFEEYENGCPEDWHDMPLGWSWWRNNANSFSTCVTPESFADSLGWAPLNAFGYQWPYDGNSFIGLFCLAFPDYINNQEYIGAELLSALEVGQEYYVSLMVSATFDNGIDYPLTTACSHLGVFFTSQAYEWQDNPLAIPNFAHVFTTDVITDSLNWTRVEGTFVADQAYTHIGIGQFFDGYLGIIDTIHVVTEYENGAYYYVDNVNVEMGQANETQSGWPRESGVKIYPNPTQGRFSIICDNSITYLEIFDCSGKEVLNARDLGSRLEVDGTSWPHGMYFIKIITGNSIFYTRIVIN